MYLWIFSLLCSTESLPTLKVESSKLEISDVKGAELTWPPTKFGVSLPSALQRQIKKTSENKYNVDSFKKTIFEAHMLCYLGLRNATTLQAGGLVIEKFNCLALKINFEK